VFSLSTALWRTKGDIFLDQSKLSNVRNWLIFQWAGQGLLVFVTLVLTIIIILVLAFALAYYGAGPISEFSLVNFPGVSEKPFWPCVQRSFLTFITLSNAESICIVPVEWLDDLIEYAQLIIALFFVAAIIAYFTVLVLRPRKLFHFKSTLNMSRDEHGKLKIVCSVYAAPVTVTNLQIRIIARVRINSTTLKNIVIRSDAPKQPLAEPYIPLSTHLRVGTFQDRN